MPPVPGVGGGPTVALVAHLDTVFPPWTEISVSQQGSVYAAPGIGDNTRGLVLLLNLLAVLNESGIETKGDILFIGSVGEEGLGDLRGVRHLLRDGGVAVDRFIAIDGGGVDRVVVDGVGSNRYRVTFSGPGGHSYGAFGRAHPHQALAKAITLLVEGATPLTVDGPKTTFSVGRIGGGTSINSIPFTSWMEVDLRSVSAEKLRLLDEAFRAAIATALEAENESRLSGDALTVEIEPVGRRPAGQGDRSTSLVQHAVAVLENFGIAPALVASSTDANVPIAQGIPAIVLGRGGRSANAHAPNESWDSTGAYRATQIALLVTLAEAGVAETEE